MGGAIPRAFSPVPADTDYEATSIGMKMLGFDAEADDGLFDQSRNVGLLLGARDTEGGALYPSCVIQIGRRATKSTSVMATMIGRAMTRPGYKGLVTAQSGNIASAIVVEHGAMLEANGYSGFKRSSFAGEDEPDGDGTMRLLRNGGREKIEFRNGSVIFAVPPTSGAVRSRAADDIWIDEGGEFEGEKGTDFLNAVLPLMDTKGELAQLIVSGTPGKVRAGMFWDLLEEGRKGEDPDLGILDYSAEDHDDPEDREVWARVHPGPSSVKADGSTLTSMRTLERRFKKMPLPQFQREYLCMWPASGADAAVDMDAWARAEREAPELPGKYAWAYDVAPDGSTAAVCAAWRDEDGNAWVEVMDYRLGTDWLVRFIQNTAKHNRQAIAYDKIGGNMETAARLDALKPRVKTHGYHYTKGVVPAEMAFIRELTEGRLRHSGQPDLTNALDGAVWRQGEGYRLWARKHAQADPVPAVAAALALWEYDTVVYRRGSNSGVLAPV